MVVGAPFIGINGGSIPGGIQDGGLKIPSCAVFFQKQLDLAAFTTDDPQDGSTVILPRAMAPYFIGEATRWILGVLV